MITAQSGTSCARAAAALSPSMPGTKAIAKRTRWVWPPDSLLVRRPAMSAVPVRWRTSSTSRGWGYIEATIVTSSRTDKSPDQRSGLEHRPDRAGLDRLGRRESEKRHGATVRCGEPEEHLDGGRLAGSVGAEQGHGLTWRDQHVKPSYGADGTEGLGEIRQHDTTEGDVRGFLGDLHGSSVRRWSAGG